ncbi:uncharacterized protein FOMMEDRAFT_114825 [Fomitiporia mediterranea MF3/22]|uniref:uncharacterized protein n=1 Tax=Fomitiporia mediterranea (strain MF3/22) TaxID=694068 RepID=UPI00044095E7|nr:uncharacterized protein FOMMEDRAFT_114825 [Fomitiporia mediterranea MF3/22]EJC98002.1 hypothetical protein FOMMEDRAFT_114825 [Fomitiporia mediterranea MF3/22]
MHHDALATTPGLPVASVSASSPPADHAKASSRRIFLGPLPYRINNTGHADNEASDFVSKHGLRIFLQQGGRIEEWTEAKAKEYKERLKERILESAAWHTVLDHAPGKGKRKKKKGMHMPTVEWRGDTFEIGKVAGVSVNMLATPEPEVRSNTSLVPDTQWRSDRTIRKAKSATMVHWDESRSRSFSSTGPVREDETGKMSFVTARTNFSDPESPGYSSFQVPQTISAARQVSENSDETQDERNDIDGSTSSKTRLFSDAEPVQASNLRGAKSEGDLPKTRPGLRSILTTSPTKDKGKGKAVRYAETPVKGTPSGSRSPAPPEEVLGREPTEVEVSSAAASAEAELSEANGEDDEDEDRTAAVMRDRMLVRVFRCDHEGLKFPFNEQECRMTRGLDSKEWDEFLVIWRNRRIELYEDYRAPCKERILGHKHLAFVIPLSSTETKLSLYSPVDLSFCLICPPTPTKSSSRWSHRSIFHRSPHGLNVFVLKPKSRSRALDWVWNIWMELGGQLPDYIEVSCPLVHSRVRIPIPEGDNDWHVFTRDYIVDECDQAMEGSFAWQTVIHLPVLSGRKVELCWRAGARLDWVWLRSDVDGNERAWEVLFGMVMNFLGAPTQLELHLSSHYPSQVLLDDGKHLEEPPSIEGFVHTYKRKTQTRVQYYLATHDGYLCSIQAEKVVPPPTPTDLKSFAKSEDEFREDEHTRLRTQVMNARLFWDLRSVLLVRRAVVVIPVIKDESIAKHARNPTSEPDGEQNGELATRIASMWNEEAELRRSESDVGDEGGEDGLNSAKDKGRLKMHRSFEVVLKNGRILRFETHSTKVAIEWVTHLRALVKYWTKRYRDDAVTEMNIRQSLGEEKVTVSKRYCKNGYGHPTPTPDVENASLYMDEYWNWCVLEGCRQIVKSGRVYMKTKFRAQYKHAHLILIRGTLVIFKVTNDFSLHNHQISRINLIDAYVCSGYYAALALPQEEWDPNAPPIAKLFPDGLETRDRAEDTLFMLWYRPHDTSNINYADAKGDMNMNMIAVPELHGKKRVMFFRARSRLERDAWCWALNCEIEKIVRRTKVREGRIRNLGMPV